MTNGITPEEEKFIDQQDLKNRFPEECKRLPVDYLKDNEKILVEKCINQEDFTDDELIELKQLLADYRPFLKRYDPIKIEENLEENIKTIKSSTELLRLLDNPNRYRFDMHCKLKGQLVRLQFKLKPVSDSDYIELLDVQTRIFKELDNKEKIAYSKLTSNTNQPLTPEEENMIQQIQDKIVEIFGDVDKNNDHIFEFLLNHVELIVDPPLTREEYEILWKELGLGTRALVYEKCKEILKIDEDLEVDLFPAIG